MAEITEIFVMRMKDPDRAVPICERTREDFTSVEGVISWKTYVSINPEKPTLFTDVFIFPDEETAKRVSPTFADRPATQAFLAEIE